MNRVIVNVERQAYAYDEELKTLRTNLLFSGDEKKVVMVTSCLAGEGKTSIVFELAKSLTEIGKKVLILDTDIRKSALLRTVKEGKVEKGLSHLLSGQCKLSEIVCSTNIPKLHMIFAGRSVPNPSELLSKEILEKMVENFREIYDYVLIDSAPLGMVADAMVVGKVCDASILVVKAGEVKYKLAQKVLVKLQTMDAPNLGVVLNQVEQKQDRYYSGKQYKRYYGK